MKAALVGLPGNEALTAALASELRWPQAALETRRFPDGETYLRLDADWAERTVAVVCSLDRPDEKILPLLFAAETLRELGARRVGLCAPYLAYMRQDRRFNPGEAVTSRSFARLLSSRFDWLVTVDPHLHRFRGLEEIYSIPTRVAHAAPALAAWIAENVSRPLLIGPDQESEQWVAEVARRSAAPHAVSTKVRRGDRSVAISMPDLTPHRDRTPVVLDDIISSARTMAETTRQLVTAGFAAPICVGVHGLFAGDAEQMLRQAGAARIVTTRTVPHRTNGIEIAALLAPALSALATPSTEADHAT